MLRNLILVLSLLAAPLAGAAESGLPNPQVVIKTTQGDITLRLFRDKAPVTVENFLQYVDDGFYNGTIFHRVIPNFMIQGGGMLPDMSEKETREPIVNESKNRLHNVRGTVAMARTGDPDSATAQFFINQRTNLRLDWAPGRDGYTVFGEVTDGMNVVDFISTTPVQTVGPHTDVPAEPILIKEIVRKSLFVIGLSVNLNKIALIRNSRDTRNPDIPLHAQMCIDAGADGITVHPRPDQRHIRASDCFDLAGMLAVEFNIEGNPMAGPRKSDRDGVDDYPGFMELVRAIRPAQCTLVPDGDAQLTSDHGFDLKRDGDTVAPLVAELKALGIRTSLFMDPDVAQIRLAAQTGADRIELYTESYARACAEGGDVDTILRQFVRAAEVAAEEGLGVNAGHDLDLVNLPAFAAAVPNLLEVSIGHALTVDALRMGLAQSITAYQRALGKN